MRTVHCSIPRAPIPQRELPTRRGHDGERDRAARDPPKMARKQGALWPFLPEPDVRIMPPRVELVTVGVHTAGLA